MTDAVLLQTDPRGVAMLTFNRPEKHNAFDDAIIAELTTKLIQLNNDKNVRIVILTGAGKSFSAGADLNWMRSMEKFSEAENIEDALKLAELMDILNTLRKPTIARVNGAVYGGGVGLVACCDIAVASDTAKIALSEVRLGLVPSVISPYVIAAIGAHQARRYFLTAEAISAQQAQNIGLVHEVAAPDKLDEAVEKEVDLLLKAGPKALTACKELIAANAAASVSARRALKQKTAQLIAQLRVSDEGQEGLSAFLEKRSPKWAKETK
ncbi:MAG TPA: enoyl-CoA hydratase/isomerase family protein [Gammaproteobacteria bacterium]|nr:enoyl-CoA hydratase/isomerase family protein [Gammaproteobacteria bacterium]